MHDPYEDRAFVIPHDEDTISDTHHQRALDELDRDPVDWDRVDAARDEPRRARRRLAIDARHRRH